MSNNNCLSPWYPAMESIGHCNSETYLPGSPNVVCFKDADIFLKSQVSLADTACDEHSPISHKF